MRIDGGGGTLRSTALPRAPAPGLALSQHVLWLGLRDGTLRRVPVTAGGLASSPWPKARGGATNAGRPVMATLR